MKDSCYLIVTESGIDRMTKTPPRKAGRYVKVTVEVPDPPEVTITLPATSPEVTGVLHEQPIPVDGLVWCDVHDDIHQDGPVTDEPASREHPCNPADWSAISREPTHG